MPQITNKIFKTKGQEGNEIRWVFSHPKETGAHSSGEYGGFYRDSQTDTFCLIKQDPKSHLNIAEFLAGAIYNEISPDVSAKIQLVKVNDTQQISRYGTEVYLVSNFIPGWESDLYTAVEKSLKRNHQRSSYKLVETAQLIDRLVIRSAQLNNVFQTENQKGNYLNFGQVTAASLLVNNTDTHVANIGVVLNPDGSKKLAIVDYAAAFRNMTFKINPHSFKKYLTSHTLNREGWNNFLFYPESLKITPEFVFELDKAAKTKLESTVTAAFDEIAKFYGIRPIVNFAVRAGFSLPLSEASLVLLEKNPAFAQQKIGRIKTACLTSLRQRQRDLSRFSAQIKLDLCVQPETLSQKSSLTGTFVDKTGRAMSINDVIFDHFNYFKEIILGAQKFKFRKSTHKHQAHLIQDVKQQLIIAFASFLFVSENRAIQEQYNIISMEDAIAALQNGVLDKSILERVLNKKYLVKAKAIFFGFEQANQVSKFNRCVEIIEQAGVPLSLIARNKLEVCTKLQLAILDLHIKCAKLAVDYDEKQKTALNTYQRETITLALQGAQNYKNGYKVIEQNAVAAINHNVFEKYARTIGNIIYIALLTVSVVGLFAAAYSKREKGFLFFRGPEHDLPIIAAIFNDLNDPDHVSLC